MVMAVCTGATLMCSEGDTPSTLNVIPVNRVLAGPPMANVMDGEPLVNISPFGLCSSLANPAVIAVFLMTGVQEAPCVPATVPPWIVGAPTVLVGPMPAVDLNARLMCAYAGVITIVQPAAANVSVP